MQCSELEEQAYAYALGALDPDEREALDRHAETCPSCRRLLDDATLAASALALAAPMHRAPDELHVRIRRQIRTEGRSSRRSLAPQRLIGTSISPGSPTELPARVGSSATPARFWMRWQAVAASLAIVLLLGSAVWIAVLQMQMNRLQSRSQAMQRGLADFEGQRAALMLLASDGTSRFAMQPTDSGNAITGAVIWNQTQHKCSVFAAGLQNPAPDQAYHVWLVGADRSWDQGELMAAGPGTAEKTIDLSRYTNQSSYQLIVSLQPRQAGEGEWHPILRAWIGAQ